MRAFGVRLLPAFRVGGLLLGVAGSSGCLPGSGRPTPGQVTLTVTGDDALENGLTTADDWTITFDTFLVTMRSGELDGTGTCVEYSGAGYTRLLDLARAGAQKLSTLFALGSCHLALQASEPESPAELVLGDGVTRDDQATLVDGAVMRVEGRAVKGASQVAFNWPFTQAIFYDGCGPIEFRSGESVTLDIRAHAEVLFSSGEPLAARFDGLAAADVNGDGELALDEVLRTNGPLLAQVQEQMLSLFRYEDLPPNSGVPACQVK